MQTISFEEAIKNFDGLCQQTCVNHDNNKSEDYLDYLHIQKVKQLEKGESTKTLAQVKDELKC